MLGKVKHTRFVDEIKGLFFWDWIQGARPFEQPTCGADTGLDDVGALNRATFAGSNV